MPKIIKQQRMWVAAAAALAVGASASPAQAIQAEYAPIVVKAGDDVSLRMIFWNQVWARMVENNPGSPGDNWTPDIAIRRARALFMGRIKDDVLTMFHIGINNQTFRNNEFGSGINFFVHDAWTEFKVAKTDSFRLDAGAGLLYWNGISRMTNASTLNLLAIDAPITNWPIINATDQFARQLGIYVKGHIAGGFIDYRIAAVKPFSGSITSTASDGTWGTSSYIKLQFWDKESNVLPYAVGTYLGKKRVANIGFGHHHQFVGAAGDDILMLGVDAFLDMPFGENGEGGALTAYAVFYNFDFGDNLPGLQVRNVGIANTFGGGNTEVLNGNGNAYASIGTGQSVYGQVGYLLPGEFLGMQVQPYLTGQVSFWEDYEDMSPVLGAGSNFFLVGHHAKLTFHYRLRPLMVTEVQQNADDKVGVLDGFASEMIVQMMVFL